MALLSVTAIVLFSFSTIVYAYFKHAFGYWKSKQIPYVEPAFPFGNAKGVGRKYHCSEFLKQIYDKHKTSGIKMIGIYLFATSVAIVLDMEMVKNIFNRDFWIFDEKMQYLDEVNEEKFQIEYFQILAHIAETLRKYPISMTTRMTKKDYVVDGTEIVIDKRTHLIILVHAFHNDPMAKRITFIRFSKSAAV